MIRKKNNIDFSKFENNHLSIWLSLDGFSFCVKKHLSDEVEILGVYPFEEKNNLPTYLLQQVKEIYEKEPVLSQKYKSVTVSHSNHLVTQVPSAFFNENQLKTYLQNTVKVLDNDYITYDVIDNLEIVNVYIPFVNINNYLLDKYGSFVFKHSATILIEKLQFLSKKNRDSCFVNVHASTIEVVVFKNNVFTLYNCFFCETKEDFSYYILFVAEQLEMHLEEFQLTLMGEIDEKSPLYKTIRKYVQKITFYQPKKRSKLLEGELPHNYFTLLHQ